MFESKNDRFFDTSIVRGCHGFGDQMHDGKEREADYVDDEIQLLIARDEVGRFRKSCVSLRVNSCSNLS